MGPNSDSVLFASGAVAGICEAIAVQPFDMVKTRHQLFTGKNPGVFSTLAALYKEGGVTLWYRGMSAELVGMVPKSSVMYGTFGVTHRFVSQESLLGDTALSAAVSGFVAGVPEALTVTPAQIVKVRLQAREHKGKYNGPVDCVRKLLQEEGISAFLIGLRPTIVRNSIWNTVYFGTMFKLKALLPPTNDKFESLGQTFLSGFFGAVFATCFNAPFDVVKTRFQCQTASIASASVATPLKYHGTFQALLLIYREEGLLSCYKGFRPKAIRMGLGGAVAITVYDMFNSWFL